jgi:hypothetical protein
VDGLETKVDVLQAIVGGLDTKIDHLHVQLDRRLDNVEVRQEQMGDEIHLIAEAHAAVLAAIERDGEKTRTLLDRRLLPLEESVRQLWRRVDAGRL